MPWGSGKPVSHNRTMLLRQLQQAFVKCMWLNEQHVAHKGQGKGPRRVLASWVFDKHQVRLRPSKKETDEGVN